MARPKTAVPTDRELEILRVLWDLGPSTARDVFEVLDRSRKTAYSSVLTVLLAMLEKGYVSRDASGKSHVFRANYSEAQVEERLVTRLLDGVFGGSAMGLVTRALSLRGASRKEREEIRRLLDGMEGSRDDAG